MARVDALMSDYRDDSDAARVRALPGGGSAEVAPWTADVLEIGARLHALTGGAFDPTIRPARLLYRFSRREEPPPAPEALAAAMAKVGWPALRLDAAARRLTVGPNGADLDFGGVAKGFANDVAAEALREAGIEDALLAIGGEVLALGRRADGGPWRVGIAHLREPGRLAAEVDLESGEAASTSGDAERYFLQGGVRRSHVIDPRTGVPVAGGPASVTVLYRPPPEASGPMRRAGAVADALATALAVAGAGPGRAMARQVPGAEAVMLIEGPGGRLRAVATRGARRRARLAGDVAWEGPRD
jgi:thiamine biosynthesis lipoprotein